MPSKFIENKPSSSKIAMAYHGFYDEQVPSVIFDAIVSVKYSRAIKCAKIGALLLTGFLIAVVTTSILQLNSDENIPSISSEQLAISAHATFANDADYPVRVGVDNLDHLEKWVSNRLAKQIKIRKLDEIGFTLLGANLVPDGNRIAAAIVYENKQTQRMTLLIRNSPDTITNEQPKTGRQGEFNWMSWENRLSQQVIVSEVEQTELKSVFESF